MVNGSYKEHRARAHDFYAQLRGHYKLNHVQRKVVTKEEARAVATNFGIISSEEADWAIGYLVFTGKVVEHNVRCILI